jgi:hypothetical protein
MARERYPIQKRDMEEEVEMCTSPACPSRRFFHKKHGKDVANDPATWRSERETY